MGCEVRAACRFRRASHVEAEAVRAVRSLTGDGGADAATPLMEAGVDSLAATELVSQLRALTGLELSPTLVFEHPTPRAIARTSARARAAPTATAARRRRRLMRAIDTERMRRAAGGGGRKRRRAVARRRADSRRAVGGAARGQATW